MLWCRLNVPAVDRPVAAFPIATMVAIAALATLATIGVVLRFHDLLDAGQLFACIEVDQGHALRGSPHLADLAYRSTNQHTTGGDQHDLVAVINEHGPHQLAITVGSLDRNHAFGAAAVTG